MPAAHRAGRRPAARLRWLILTDNRIEIHPPAGIGRGTGLRKLALAGNRLTALPPEMAACTSLENAHAANRIATFPDWLLGSASAGVAGLCRQSLCATLDAAWQAEAHTRPVPWAALATDGFWAKAPLGDPPGGVVGAGRRGRWR